MADCLTEHVRTLCHVMQKFLKEVCVDVTDEWIYILKGNIKQMLSADFINDEYVLQSSLIKQAIY